MKDIYLISLKINGVKSLENDVILSFYKKCIVRPIDFQKYNIKGIYGTNGSGKTAIVSAVKILKEIITNPIYLNSEVNQKKLNGLINKKNNKLLIDVEYLVDVEDFKAPLLYRYSLELSLSEINTFRISHEKLEQKKANSQNGTYNLLYEVSNGSIVYTCLSDTAYINELNNETKNLLYTASLCSLFVSKKRKNDSVNQDKQNDFFYFSCILQVLFGFSLFVYLEDNDLHDDYVLNELYIKENTISEYRIIRDFSFKNENIIKYGRNIVAKDQYAVFTEKVRQLKGFIQIFKNELTDITIDKAENGDELICRLILHYDNYSVDSEFESTGIKKLIVLFRYVQRMYNGDIVFLDEMDANLHDVYLCALLEYLSEYGHGQLCFTSHNIGPMSVLKSKKKSIDFLSVDKTIYSWKKSGNYSPALLYRNGMINGSPFNVDKTDFIGVFDEEK